MPSPLPRYIQAVPVDAAGLVPAADLPVPLPFGLQPRDFLRMVEDVHDLLQGINAVLNDRNYPRLEELHDPAGFSGLISRTVATRLARASRNLVVNAYHNGYPDLLVEGDYPGNATQHGEGGLEVKASRTERSWQTHGPRSGWFVVVQFALDENPKLALRDREPTRVVAVMAAQVDKDQDWSWQPAAEGKIRSGTASMKASGVLKMRLGAVWVDPAYRATHDALTAQARLDVFGQRAANLILEELRQLGGPANARGLAAALAPVHGVPAEAILSRITGRLSELTKAGQVRRVEPRGYYALA